MIKFPEGYDPRHIAFVANSLDTKSVVVFSEWFHAKLHEYHDALKQGAVPEFLQWLVADCSQSQIDKAASEIVRADFEAQARMRRN